MAPPQLDDTLLTFMRARLAYTLSFWLLGAVALTVLSMGGLTAWHLREGFSAYLQTRDLERLDRFAALVTARLSAQASQDASHAKAFTAPDMRALLRTLAEEEGTAVRPRADGPEAPAGDLERSPTDANKTVNQFTRTMATRSAGVSSDSSTTTKPRSTSVRPSSSPSRSTGNCRR